ncbi:MAG: ATP-binding protein [Solirubrobacterales bacterium]
MALERMREEPVLALQGPRAVGKTTLLNALARAHNASVIDLDDLATREAVAADPATFVSGPAPVLIDEYQHVPVLLDAIKAELNRASSPGRFMITGSTRYDALPMAAQALTGRLHLLTVLPLAQAELTGEGGDLLRLLFDDPLALVTPKASSTSREEYAERIVAGGFPPALRRATGTARGRWFDDYLRLCLERDAAELARIQQRAALPELLARLAAQTGQVLNVAAAGASAGLNKRTADNYTKLLEALFLIERLPAWGRTLRARAARLPKVHVVDSGLAARLLRLTPERLLRRDVAALQQFGHLLETFVVGEVRKQASWLEGIAGLGHWRTHDGAELDLVIERDDGSVVGIEVKAAGRVARRDTAGLRATRNSLGEAFVAGAVLYAGSRSYTAEDRIHVLPVDRLWQSP